MSFPHSTITILQETATPVIQPTITILQEAPNPVIQDGERKAVLFTIPGKPGPFIDQEGIDCITTTPLLR